ncbi:hypothetical protein CspeluHIS016_0100110 [Cutaneotrichosporon spelunceum]|uniref:Uncharacterized protein n=1 Tax=Cutaneotrichosporon spelunceum TaxID=1672016 RepID=A0AAD3TNC9_9TREE|nr:hypothetical protein CspeluHIS016_0100110 [Cutaneotrichosporon spelunceum]
MDVPHMVAAYAVYASPSTECLLQRPGGPRFATQETDPFGDPYLVGVQVGFRRRSLGTRPWDEAPAPTGRRHSTASTALEVGRKARRGLRRASQGSPLHFGSATAPAHVPERERSQSLSAPASSASASPKRAPESPLPCQPEGVEGVQGVQVEEQGGEVPAQPGRDRRRGSLREWLRHERHEWLERRESKTE